MAFASDDIERAIALRSRQWPSPGLCVGQDDGLEWMPAGWTSSDAEVEALMAYQRSFTPDLDRKGQAAYAIGDYSYMLASAFVPLLVGSRIVPDFSTGAVRIGFDEQPIAFKGQSLVERRWRVRLIDPRAFVDEADGSGGELTEVFRAHVEQHCSPVVEALHVMSGLSRNALWRLVGDSFSQIFLDAGRHHGCVERAKAEALAVLKAPGSPLTNRQLHYFDIEVRRPDQPDRVLACVPFRARGGCCRYYTVEGGHLCATCVLQDPVERDAKLQQHLRKRFGLPAEPAVAKAGAVV